MFVSFGCSLETRDLLYAFGIDIHNGRLQPAHSYRNERAEDSSSLANHSPVLTMGDPVDGNVVIDKLALKCTNIFRISRPCKQIPYEYTVVAKRSCAHWLEVTADNDRIASFVRIPAHTFRHQEF